MTNPSSLGQVRHVNLAGILGEQREDGKRREKQWVQHPSSQKRVADGSRSRRLDRRPARPRTLPPSDRLSFASIQRHPHVLVMTDP